MILVLDLETVPSEVPPSPPRPNMANEVLSRLARFYHLSSEPSHPNMSERELMSFMRFERTIAELGALVPHPGSDFAPPPCHKIVCAGVALLTDTYELEDLACVEGDSEEAILRELARLFSEDKTQPFAEHTVVTFNGRGFDLPVIAARAARYGIVLPYWSSRWHYRYAEDPHFDLLDFWSAYGGSPKVSLSQMSHLFGLPGKREGETGASVAAMISEGRLEDVKRYCLSDVVQTAGVFLRTQLFRGKLHKDVYRRAAHRLLEACEGAFGLGLEWVSEKTDRKVFLLEEP